MSDGLLAQAFRRLGLELTRARFALPPTSRPLNPETALANLPEEPTVLFLCYGNICRSPLAERYARYHGDDDVEFLSSGFHEPEDRPSPELAVDAGFDYGVDLSAHRSERVTEEDLATSDLTLVMDARNYRQVAREFPEHVSETWFLRAFGSDARAEIPDPYDADRKTYDRVYGEVTDAVDGLLEALEDRESETSPVARTQM